MMAGRPRLYSTAAEKTRAYRQRRDRRLAMVDRLMFEQTSEALDRLMDAVYSAKKAGDPLALQIDNLTRLDLLENLARLFKSRVGVTEQQVIVRPRRHSV